VHAREQARGLARGVEQPIAARDHEGALAQGLLVPAQQRARGIQDLDLAIKDVYGHFAVRPLVLAGLVERGRTLAVVDLRLLAGQELQHVEALRHPGPQPGDKALHRVVAVREAVPLDQILVDAHRVALELHLRFDPRAVRLARRGAGGARREHRADGVCRWPGWRSLADRALRAGGHPGGICLPRHAPDGLAIHSGTALDLPMTGAASEQRLNGNA